MALAWTEPVTLLSRDHVPGSVFDLARAWFDQAELVNRTVVTATISVWNRLAAPVRAVPEGCHRGERAAG